MAVLGGNQLGNEISLGDEESLPDSEVEDDEEHARHEDGQIRRPHDAFRSLAPRRRFPLAPNDQTTQNRTGECRDQVGDPHQREPDQRPFRSRQSDIDRPVLVFDAVARFPNNGEQDQSCQDVTHDPRAGLTSVEESSRPINTTAHTAHSRTESAKRMHCG